MNGQIIYFLLLLISFKLYAQPSNSNILYWSDKKLEWTDFKGIPNSYSDYDSELKYFIGYSLKDNYYDGIHFTSFETYCYIDKSTSWYKSKIASDSYLLYNQILFNICELYSRYLEDELNALVGSYAYISSKAENLLIEYSNRNSDRISEIQFSTNYGTDIQEIMKWSKKIEEELSQNSRKIIPDYQLTGSGIGGSFELGYGILMGSINSYFSNGPTLSYGFEYNNEPLIFYLHGTLVFGNVSKTFTKDYKIWDKNNHSGLVLINLSIGYNIFENQSFKLSPYFGITLTEFSITDKDKKYDDHQLLSYSPILGIMFDYKFYTSIDIVGYDLNRNKTDWFIRTNFFIVPMTYGNDFSGSSINLSMGIGGLASFLN